MIQRRAFLLATTLFGLGCSSGASSNETVQALDHLDVAITAATLGDECAEVGSGTKSSTSTSAGAEACDSSQSGLTGCGSSDCRASNLQLTATLSGAESAELEVVRAVLYDEATNVELDTLQARTPTSWNGSAYVAWNEVVASGNAVKASYTLSSPKWSTISGKLAQPSGSQKFYLLVTLASGGKQIILRSGTLSREPQVAT